ncbi:MAG: elongation factor Ts [Chloroflexota bacterium]|nr:elongation factor Ts [Dehalococcoidia bacterium]MDW8253522.1 elongation factor Ts [Chloroflexota bacterium]
MEITAAMVKELREKTGAGVMESKRALIEAQGDMRRAEALIEEWAGGRIAKRAGRATNQGVVEAYVHGGRIGALVELNCETDFVARNEAFRELAHDIAMQVAAMDPRYLRAEEIPPETPGRPEDLALLAMPFIKDPSKTIDDLVKEMIRKTGENIQVRRFARFELGA